MLEKLKKDFKTAPVDLLSGGKFTSLMVEIMYVPGFRPDRKAIANVRTFLLQHLNKPDGIYISQHRISSIRTKRSSWEQVDSVLNVNRLFLPEGKRIVVYILYTNTEFIDKRVLGQAFHGSSIVIYGRPVKKYKDVFSSPGQTTIESALILHELGHLFGLVNTGTPMVENHIDSSHGNHCVNRKCLMSWATSLKPKFGPLILEASPSFDESCLNDLRHNGGK